MRSRRILFLVGDLSDNARPPHIAFGSSRVHVERLHPVASALLPQSTAGRPDGSCVVSPTQASTLAITADPLAFAESQGWPCIEHPEQEPPEQDDGPGAADIVFAIIRLAVPPRAFAVEAPSRRLSGIRSCASRELRPSGLRRTR